MAGYETRNYARGDGLYVEYLQAGEEITAYSLVYLDGNGQWALADASAAATATVVGLATQPIHSGQKGRVLQQGYANSNAWSWTVGADLYATDVAGVIGEVAGTEERKVGVAVSATLIYFDPALGGGGISLNGGTAEIYSTDGGTTFEWRYADGSRTYLGGTGYTDPAVAIEAAWSYLNTQGGGLMRTRGPGETWTVATTIDSQGDKVSWYSDWSLEFKLADSVDGDVIRITHDYFNLKGLNVHGNYGGQSGGVPIGIEVYGGSHGTIELCYVHDTYNSGIEVNTQADGVTIDKCYIYHTRGTGGSSGIVIWGDTDPVTNSAITNCKVDTVGLDGEIANGIHVVDSDYCEVSDCIIQNVEDIGLEIQAQQRDSYGNTANNIITINTTQEGIVINGNDGSGIFLYDTVVTNFHIKGSSSHGLWFSDGAKYCEVTGGTIRDAGDIGLRYSYSSFCEASHIIIHSSTSDGVLFTYATDCEASDISVYNAGGRGILATDSSHRTRVENSYVNNPTNEAIYFWGIDDGEVKDCTINTANTGVSIAGGSTDCLVKDNHFLSVTTPISDSGTGTILPTLKLQFVDGTTFLSDETSGPLGWEIDADTEYAITLGHLPLEVQQVVRWKIWATSIVAEADAMRLHVKGYGGASNEAYTTETVDVADHPSTTTNFAANDVIYWVLDSGDDTDIDDMLGGDQVTIKVLHEGVGNGDCATDAVFTCAEIEYV